MTSFPSFPEDPGNVVHTAHLRVDERHVAAFRERIIRHAEVTRAEPGCLKFDVRQEAQSPQLFFLFEVYRDNAALEAHRNSSHFHAFRGDVDPWVVERQWWHWSPVSLTVCD